MFNLNAIGRQLGMRFAIAAFCIAGLIVLPSAQAHAQQKHQNGKKAGAGITSGELENFDKFLDKNYEVRHDLVRDPKLVDNENYIINHPALATFLRNHPGVKSEILKNPDAFMNRERAFEKNEDKHGGDITTGELANFDKFLDKNYQVRHDLVRDPKLVDNENYIINHPALATFLRNHPGVKSEILKNPDAFMNRERAFEKNEDANKK